MDEHRHVGAAGDANSNDSVTPPHNLGADTSATGGAGDAMTTAVGKELTYTVTVPQALQLFADAGRKVPSERSIQRYCKEGSLLGERIKTKTGTEWLINEESLKAFIDKQPIVVTGAASVATPPPTPEKPSVRAPDTSATGDAGVAMKPPAGETRPYIEILIENVQLKAEAKGKDTLILAIEADRNFLRDEMKTKNEQLTQLTARSGETNVLLQALQKYTLEPFHKLLERTGVVSNGEVEEPKN